MARLLKAAAVTAIAIATAACATPDEAPVDASAPLDGYLQIGERVTAGVHLMRQRLPNFAGVVGNVTIIEQDDSIVLVDSGSSYGDGARIVRAVRDISRKPVSAVIITHWHNDHPLGLAAIIEAWPDAEIIAHEATRAALAAGRTGVPTEDTAEYRARRAEQIRGFMNGLTQDMENAATPQEREGFARSLTAQAIRLEDAPGTHVVLPTRTFTDLLTLDDPRRPIEVRYEGRANTDGDAVVWLPRQRILIAGDTVVWPVPYNFNTYPEENVETLRRLRAYNYAALIPGHGEVLRDKSYLDLLIAFGADVRAQVAPLALSTTLEEVTAQVTMNDYAQRFAGDDPWLRFWFVNYALQPLVQSAYREARGEPIGPPPADAAP